MGRKARHISLLEIGDGHFSRLQIEGTGKEPSVLAFNQQKGAWDGKQEATNTAFQEFAATHQLQEDRIISVLPRHRVTTRILEVPSLDQDEIESMVQLSAEEFVPYPIDEVQIDFTVLSHTADGESKVLVALAHQDLIQAHLDVLASAGLEPEHIYLSTTCLVKAAIRSMDDKPERFGLVNLADSGLEVLVLEENHLAFSRGVALSMDWEAGAESMGVLGGGFEELAMEVRTSLGTYRRESSHGEGVDSLWVGADAAQVETAVQELAQELGKDVQPASFVQGVDSQFTVPNATLLGAVYTILDRGAIVIDLIPEALVEARKSRSSKLKLRNYAAAALVVLGGLLLCFGQMVYQRTSYISELEGQLSLLGPDASSIMAKQQQLKIIRSQLDRQGSILEILGTISEAAPKNKVNITRMNYSRGSGVDLWGRAKSVDDVHLFTETLRGMTTAQLSMFEHATNVYTSKAREGSAEIFQYQITMNYPEDGGAGGE